MPLDSEPPSASRVGRRGALLAAFSVAVDLRFDGCAAHPVSRQLLGVWCPDAAVV